MFHTFVQKSKTVSERSSFTHDTETLKAFPISNGVIKDTTCF